MLDLDAMDDTERRTLNGEGALLAAIGAHRTGRMGDIVATIQAEQDRVIRSDLAGILVVQGGPGTGKTAVALHRAAYLLYTYRERLANRGVLVVGPNDLFLRYIGQVLPSLGETGVVMSTPGAALSRPGRARRGGAARSPRSRATCGWSTWSRPRCATGSGCRHRPLQLAVDGQVVELTPAAVDAARSRARRSRRPHNLARNQFVREMLDHLADGLGAAPGHDGRRRQPQGPRRRAAGLPRRPARAQPRLDAADARAAAGRPLRGSGASGRSGSAAQRGRARAAPP